jgi:hypothetical protein
MYVDKVDGKVPQKFFDRKNNDWRTGQAEILRKIEKHQNANFSYLEEGVRLLELAQKAASLYAKQEMKEKQRILDFLFSNCLWKDGALILTTENRLTRSHLRTLPTKRERPLLVGKVAFLKSGSTEWTNFATVSYTKISLKLIHSFKP